MNRDTTLDIAARRLHDHALAAVPVALRVQLHPREQAPRGRAWGTTLAMAVVGGLALAATWQVRVSDHAPAAIAGVQNSMARTSPATGG